MHYISEDHFSIMGGKSSSKKTLGVGLIIAAIIVGIIMISGNELTQLSFVKVKVDNTELEVGDISESGALWLGGVIIVALFTPGIILALKN